MKKPYFNIRVHIVSQNPRRTLRKHYETLYLKIKTVVQTQAQSITLQFRVLIPCTIITTTFTYETGKKTLTNPSNYRAPIK